MRNEHLCRKSDEDERVGASRLPLEARRAAWEALWRVLLSDPKPAEQSSNSGSVSRDTSDVESELPTLTLTDRAEHSAPGIDAA
jgi:hypothetical protein